MQCSQFWAAIETINKRSSEALFIIYYRVGLLTTGINLFVGWEPDIAFLVTLRGVELVT